MAIICFCVKRTRITHRTATDQCVTSLIFPYKGNGEIARNERRRSNANISSFSRTNVNYLIICCIVNQTKRGKIARFFSPPPSFLRVFSRRPSFLFSSDHPKKMRSRIGLTIFVFWCTIESGFSQSPSPTAAPAEEKPALASAAIQECRESAPSVFMPVLLTLMVVCAAILIGFVFWKYYWRIKHGTFILYFARI